MSWWAMHVFPAVTVAAYLTAAIRLLAFRREGKRHKPGYALLASGLIGFLLAGIAQLVFFVQPVGPLTCALAVLLAGQSIKEKGNVARMFPMPKWPTLNKTH
ncbi:MAG: phage holin family protein [Aeromonas sp.]